MRYLILGGDGMLGHQLLKAWQGRHEVVVTLRGQRAAHAATGLFTPANSIEGLDVANLENLASLLADYRPDVVVNAVGVIKQRSEAKEFLPSLEINAVFPHRLRLLCAARGARMIHFSTDCVFNGRRGNYTLTDVPDAEDLYGRSKHLGEVGQAPAVTIRSSIIGCELKNRLGLVEWYLGQRGPIKGFTEAWYSGLTTLEMARVVELVAQRPDLHGVWQVSAPRINKYELLALLGARLGRRDVTLVPDSSLVCDRSLDGSAFARMTGYCAPGWDVMLAELATQILKERNLNEATDSALERQDHPDHRGHRVAGEGAGAPHPVRGAGHAA